MAKTRQNEVETVVINGIELPIDQAKALGLMKADAGKQVLTSETNVRFQRKGDKLVVEVDLGRDPLALAGEKLASGKRRAGDLLATSRGFMDLGDDIAMSLNVIRR
jgi:hypothetical protein